MRAIVVDLDGTLADCEHRVVNGRCDHSRIKYDEVNHNLKSVMNRMATDHKIIICTARCEGWREETEAWLAANAINYNELIMRGRRDTRPDYLVKYDLWRNEIRDRYDITCVFDDNTPVVRMWRDIGLTCFQVQNTDY